jgi:NAD(P)-dependent dehydrogenase (short-subunit alcohol dehydrogenase family)
VNDNLEGKIATVTGAARGIGRAIAAQLIARGAVVMLSDIDEATLTTTVSELGAARAMACDVRDETQVTALFEQIAREHGHLDICVANAGVGGVQPMLDMALTDWRRVTSINLDGVFLVGREAARLMAPRGSGSIVNIASITGLAGSAGVAHYAAAKAGVINLTKTLNSEMRASGIRVNCVCPGFIKTDLVTSSAAAFNALLSEGVNLEQVVLGRQSRWGTPDDVANAVCFLAGDRAPWISGAHLVVDGGWTASLI